MSKNIAKGLLFEKKMSLYYHQKFPAFLISSQFLRKYGCGQVDLAYFNKGEFYLYELKASPVLVIKKKQRARLVRSANFLSEITEVSSQLRFLNSCQMTRPYLSFK